MMARHGSMRAAVATSLALALGCGGGDGGGDSLANAGFRAPEVTTSAYREVGPGQFELVGAADFSCLGGPSEDVATEGAVTLSGTVQDFQNKTAVAGATVTAYDDTAFAGAGVASTTAGGDGGYELELPAGGERWAFEVTASGALDTYLLNQYFEPDEPEQSLTLNSVSLITAEALPAFIGVNRTPGLGILAGAIRDCNGDEVHGAIATVSSVSGSAEHLDGAATYYFSAEATSLPVRHSVIRHSNTDGLFVVIELPVSGQAFLQVWGFPTQAHLDDDDLVLLAEIPAPIVADSVVIASLEPLRE